MRGRVLGDSKEKIKKERSRSVSRRFRARVCGRFAREVSFFVTVSAVFLEGCRRAVAGCACEFYAAATPHACGGWRVRPEQHPSVAGPCSVCAGSTLQPNTRERSEACGVFPFRTD